MAENKVRKTEDRRVKRTKKVLRDCLFALLKEKTVDKITVKELTEAADVNRSTFYFYYKDINDMIIHIQNEIFDVFKDEVFTPEAKFDTVENFIEYSCRFFTFCKKHEKICRFVVSNDPNNTLAKRIKNTLLENIPDSKKVFDETDPRRYLTAYAVSAIWNIVLEWMYDGMTVSPEEMAVFVSNVYFYGGRNVLIGGRK